MVALQDLHRQIRTALELGQAAWSRQACEAILDVHPENLETILLLGELELEAGLHRSAARRFQRVLAGDPEAYLACAGLAIAHESLRDPSAALHWHSRALDLNPGNAEIRAERDRLFEEAYPGLTQPDGLSELAQARAALLIGRYAEGLEGLRRALALEPGRPEIKVSLAETLWICTRPREASELCWELLNEIPQVVKAQAVIACIAADEGDLEGARVLLREVHAQDPLGRIAGHLLAQTALAGLIVVPVDVPTVIPAAGPDDFFSGELPSWCHWMRRALWRLMSIMLPDDDAAPAEPQEEPQPRADGPVWSIGDRLDEATAGRLGQGTLGPADRVLVSEQFQAIRFDELGSAEAAGGRESAEQVPPFVPTESREPTPDSAGRAPSAAGPSEEAPRDLEPADPDATEILDEPGWLRRNELRQGREQA